MNIKISANVRSAVRGMDRVQKEARQTGASVKKMGAAVLAAGVALKALDVAGMALAATFRVGFRVIKESSVDMAEFGDRMAKQARMVGVTAKEYQGYEFAAQRAGTSVKAVSNGLKKLGRVMTDAQQGSRQLEETFAALGIKIAKADGTLRPVNDVFLELADKSQILGESAERTGVLMLLLGRSGTEMANLMEGGAAGIEELQARLVDLNAMMSDEMLADSEAFIDAQTDLQIAFRGLKIELGEELIPQMTHLATVTTDYLTSLEGKGEIEKFSKSLSNAMLDTAKATVVLAGATEAFITVLTAGPGYESFILAILSPTFSAIDALKREFEGLKEVPDDLSRIMDRTSSLLVALSEETSGAIEASLKPGMGVIQEWVSMSKQELAAIERERIKADLAARKAAREREAAAKRAARQAKAAQDKEARDAEKAHKELLDRQVQATITVYKTYQDLFGEEDLGRLDELFDNNLIAQEEYLSRYLGAVEESLRKEHEARVRSAKAVFALETLGAETDEEFLAAEQKNNEAIAKSALQTQRDIQLARDKAHAKVLKQTEENRVAQVESLNSQLSLAVDVLDASAQMFSGLSSIAMQAYEGGDQQAKNHAIALFGISQAFALATATVNTALAISQASISAPPPANIVPMVAAGVQGAAQIATIVGTTIQGIGDAGLTSETLKKAGLGSHSAIVMRNDETLLDPVGTKHITEMLAIQKAQMQNGGGAQTIRTTVELDGRVLGESVDNYLIRQQERGLAYGNRVRQEYV